MKTAPSWKGAVNNSPVVAGWLKNRKMGIVFRSVLPKANKHNCWTEWSFIEAFIDLIKLVAMWVKEKWKKYKLRNGKSTAYFGR